MRPTTSETPQQMTKRWLWRLGLLFLLCCAGLVATYLIWRASLYFRINSSLTRLHQAGYPTSLAEAEQQYYPEIPAEQNAAVFFERAFALKRLGTPMWPDYQSTNRLAFFTQENIEDINDILISNRDCLDLLRQSPAATNCRYPVQFNTKYGILLPHLAPIKESALLLSLDAVARTRNSDTAGGIEDLNAMFRLVRSLDREPVIISQQVRFALIPILAHALENMLNVQPFSDSQLSGLTTELQKCRNSKIMESATALEFCAFLKYFNMSSAEFTANSPPTGTVVDSLAPEIEYATYRTMRIAGSSVTDHALFLEIMEKQLQIVQLPFPQRLDSAAELSKWGNERTKHSMFDCGISAGLCSVMENTQFKEAIMEARLNVIHAVLAIERYRLANQNRLPDNLSALVPSVLDSVPLDPFDGKPLRFKKLTKGYMVYSIGPDRRDDGGIPSYGIRTDRGLSVREIKTNLLSNSVRERSVTTFQNSAGNGKTNSPQWDITFVVER